MPLRLLRRARMFFSSICDCCTFAAGHRVARGAYRRHPWRRGSKANTSWSPRPARASAGRARSRWRREGRPGLATDVNRGAAAGLRGRRRRDHAARLDVLDDAAVAQADRRRAAARRAVQLRRLRPPAAPSSTARRQDWDFSFNLNVRAHVRGRSRRRCRRCSPSADGRAWRIINMASVCSSIKGLPNRFVYGATQGGGDRPDQVGRRRLRAARASAATAICPGTVDTPSLQRAHQRLRRPGRGAQDVHRAPADGPARQGRGDRADRRLPRRGRIARSSPARRIAVDGGMTI